MKKQLFLIGLPLLIILFSAFSCDDRNDNSLGDFQIRIATVVSENDNKYSLILDSGIKLIPKNTEIGYKPVDGQRVFINFTILGDDDEGYIYFIRINDIWNILTKNTIILNENNADSIGNDPVAIEDIWIGSDYLNVDFLFNYGGIRPHAINLVENKMASQIDDGKVYLEFRHNSYFSGSSQLYNGLVCFKLKPYRKNDADSVAISVKVQEWGGSRTYNMTYKYNDAALQNAVTKTTIPNVSSNEYY